MEEINDTALMAEVLGNMVQEKSELVWVIPFAEELQRQIYKELLLDFVVEN